MQHPGDPDRVASKQCFSLRGSVVAVLKANNIRGSTVRHCKLNEVGIGSHKDKVICLRIYPDHVIGSHPDQPSVEDMFGIREQVGKAADESW